MNVADAKAGEPVRCMVPIHRRGASTLAAGSTGKIVRVYSADETQYCVHVEHAADGSPVGYCPVMFAESELGDLEPCPVAHKR